MTPDREDTTTAPQRSGSASCAVLIPALDEEATIAAVVEPALAAAIGPVLVVDDGSRDDTANAARAAGADVLSLPENVGKGGAVVAGARSLSVEVLVLLDADLTGLLPEHVQSLVDPVRAGEVDMTRGRFTGGRWQTATAQQLAPQLNGQRAVRRDLLLSIPSLEHTKYGLEVALTEWARTAGWRCRDVELPGVSQVMKEEKRGWLQGFSIRLRMYADILETMLKRNGGPR